MVKQRGSALIVFLWVLIVLGVFAASVAVRTRLAVKIEGYETRRFERLYDFLSAVNLARYLIEQDENPELDSPADAWYGTPKALRELNPGGRFTFRITDEESRLNLNTASPEVLRKFFEVLKTHGIVLKADPADLASAIAAWRGTGAGFGRPAAGKPKSAPFETVEELYLLPGSEPSDIEKLRPFITVYGGVFPDPLRINLNTVHVWVLEAVIRALPGGDFLKDELYNRILAFRGGAPDAGQPQVFQSGDMTPGLFMQKLGLPASIDMITMVTAFLQNASVDSRTFRVTAVSTLPGAVPYGMEAVLGSRFGSFRGAAGIELDILSWHEGIAAQSIVTAGSPGRIGAAAAVVPGSAAP